MTDDARAGARLMRRVAGALLFGAVMVVAGCNGVVGDPGGGGNRSGSAGSGVVGTGGSGVVGTGGNGVSTGTGGAVVAPCTGDPVVTPKRIVRLSFNQIAASVRSIFTTVSSPAVGTAIGDKVQNNPAYSIVDAAHRWFPPLTNPREGSVRHRRRLADTAIASRRKSAKYVLDNFATVTCPCDRDRHVRADLHARVGRQGVPPARSPPSETTDIDKVYTDVQGIRRRRSSRPRSSPSTRRSSSPAVPLPHRARDRRDRRARSRRTSSRARCRTSSPTGRPTRAADGRGGEHAVDDRRAGPRARRPHPGDARGDANLRGRDDRATSRSHDIETIVIDTASSPRSTRASATPCTARRSCSSRTCLWSGQGQRPAHHAHGRRSTRRWRRSTASPPPRAREQRDVRARRAAGRAGRHPDPRRAFCWRGAPAGEVGRRARAAGQRDDPVRRNPAFPEELAPGDRRGQRHARRRQDRAGEGRVPRRHGARLRGVPPRRSIRTAWRWRTSTPSASYRDGRRV